MPGRPDFSQEGTQGGGQHIATQNRPNLHLKDFTQTGNVAAGNTERVEIYAPTGSIYQFGGMRLKHVLEGTEASGKHSFRIYSMDDASGGLSVLLGESGYTTDLGYYWSDWQKADSRTLPSNVQALQKAVQSLMASDAQPVAIEYTNDTDVTQTKDRQIRFTIQEESF